MKRLLVAGLVCATCLVPGAKSGFGKKKPGEPFKERYTAKVVPYTDSGNAHLKRHIDDSIKIQVKMFENVDVAIQEFTSDQEVHDLAQTFHDAGDDALQKALNKNKKGYFRIGDWNSMDILYVTSSKVLKNPANAEGPARILGIIGATPLGTQGGVQNIPHTYTYIELRVDEQGNGKGLLLFLAIVKFDQQGRPVISPFPNQSYQLGEVHLEK